MKFAGGLSWPSAGTGSDLLWVARGLDRGSQDVFCRLDVTKLNLSRLRVLRKLKFLRVAKNFGCTKWIMIRTVCRALIETVAIHVHKWTVGAVMKNIAIGAGGLGFDSCAGQIGHSVANGSPVLRHFFGAVLPRRCATEMGSAAYY